MIATEPRTSYLDKDIADVKARMDRLPRLYANPDPRVADFLNPVIDLKNPRFKHLEGN